MFELETDQTYSADMGDGEQGSRDDNDDGRGINQVQGGYTNEKIETAQTRDRESARSRGKRSRKDDSHHGDTETGTKSRFNRGVSGSWTCSSCDDDRRERFRHDARPKSASRRASEPERPRERG